MSMQSKAGNPPERPGGGKHFLPRFPTGWVSESARAEAVFARSLWLLLPLQYYVFTSIPRGLARDDVMTAVAMSLMSVVAIFMLSCVIAAFVSVWRPLDPDRGDTFSRRVRMWVVGLMVCTTVSYLLLALALGVGYRLARLGDFNIYGDPVAGAFKWAINTVWPGTVETVGPALMLASNLAYTFAAVQLVLLAYRRLRSDTLRIQNLQEPSIIVIGIIVAAIMLAANLAVTFVGPAR